MNILIADDHTFMRSGLNDNLQQLFPKAVIFNAENAFEAIRLTTQDISFQLAIVDLFMPDMDGFDFLRKLCSENPGLPVIVISATDKTEHIRKVLDMGAMSFISKSSSNQQFNNVIHTVLSGGTYIPDDLVKSQDSKSTTNAEQDGVLGRKEKRIFTDRQLEILKLLTDGKSNKQIANDLDVSENTVKVHVSTILKILNVDNRIQASNAARKLGLH